MNNKVKKTQQAKQSTTQAGITDDRINKLFAEKKALIVTLRKKDTKTSDSDNERDPVLEWL